MSKSGTTIRPSASALRPIPRTTCPTFSTTPGGNTGCASGCGAWPTYCDDAGVKATVALNSQVCEVHPKAIEEMKKRGWEFMGHGTTNSTNLAGLNPEQERDTIRGILKTIEQATGKPPRGWLGSGLIETHSWFGPAPVLSMKPRSR